MRLIVCIILLSFSFVLAKAQNPVENPQKTEVTPHKIDTLSQPGYVNQGKIEGRKALYHALMFPGLGQLYNYKLIVNDVKAKGGEKKQIGNKIYTIGKFLGVYAGGTVLVWSYMQNNRNYHRFLRELQYRQVNNNKPDPNNGLTAYSDTQALTTAKNIFKRNREIVIISIIGLYGASALEAYVAARLKFFNIDDNVAMKITPTFINDNSSIYGFNPTPALKLTLRL